MEKNKKIFSAIAILIVVALAGYYMTGGTLNISPDDAAGSAIDGVKKADKYKSETATASVELEEEEVQQLLQNQDFQQLVQNKEFAELMMSAEMNMIARDNDMMNFLSTSPLEFTQTLEKMQTSTNKLIVSFASNQNYRKLIGNNSFKLLIMNTQFQTLFQNQRSFQTMMRNEDLANKFITQARSLQRSVDR